MGRAAAGCTAILAVCGGALLAVAAADVRAQFLEPEQSHRTKKSEIGRIMREDKAIPPAEQQMFDDFFLQYALPQFAAKENLYSPKDEKSAPGKEKPTGLPKVRYDFRTYFAERPAATALRTSVPTS